MISTKVGLRKVEHLHHKEFFFQDPYFSGDLKDIFKQLMRTNFPAHACHICGHISKDKKQLTIHIAAVHKKKKPFECKLCNQIFVTRGQSTNERPHECKLCDKKFKWNGHLVVYMEKIHSKAVD